MRPAARLSVENHAAKSIFSCAPRRARRCMRRRIQKVLPSFSSDTIIALVPTFLEWRLVDVVDKNNSFPKLGFLLRADRHFCKRDCLQFSIRNFISTAPKWTANK
jgi:hypothetical protein